jgi:hypothetical protein
MTAHVGPVDLVMRVEAKSEGGWTRLIYTLDSPTGRVPFSHREITGPSLQGRPEDLQAKLLHKVERLGQRLDIDDSPLLREDITRKLAGLGHDLWRQLFPAELRHAYREIRESVRSWMIISDEAWIPWELIKPHEDNRSGDSFDDDFLACRFELTRWLAGNRTPAHEIVLRRLAAVRTGVDLPQADQELSVLAGLAQSSPDVVQASVTCDSANDLLDFLESQDVDLIHFTGHGLYTADRADESPVPFPDGSSLRPVDLDGPLASRIAGTRPLVFLNACWGAQQGWAWAHLGGWASRWVSVCGCGAFLAPLWPARDQAALAFAQTFYDALLRGHTLGRAALEARQRLREERPGDPSALAYTVYGHPNARLTLGAGPVDSAISSPEPVLPSPWRPFPPLPEPPRRRALIGSRKAWAVFTLLLCLILIFTTLRFPALWRSAGPANQISMTAGIQKPGSIAPAPAPTATPKKVSHAELKVSTAGGITFEIANGGNLKSSLQDALRKAAEPLADRGISGWTVRLDVQAPRITPFDQDGLSWKSCRLVAQGRARRQGASLELGSLAADSSQTDAATACEAAAEPLAEAIVYQLVHSLRKGTS